MRALALLFPLLLWVVVACGGGEPATDNTFGSGAGTGKDGSAGASGAAGTAGAAGNAGVAGGAGTGASGGSGGSGGAAGSIGGWGASDGGAGAPSCSGTMATVPAATVVDAATASALSIVSDPGAARGLFDPSVEYAAGASSGAMAYSAVEATNDVSSRIAVSSDKGATWTFAASVNASADFNVSTKPGYVHCPTGTCTGRLVHEVPSLVYQVEDPDVNRRYKLFTHSYIVFPGDVLGYDIGYIGMYTAPDPAGPWIFENKVLGWNGASKLSSDNVARNVNSLAQMNDCVVLTEPGALARSGGILDIAVGCGSIVGGAPQIRIELLRSVDFGMTFNYVARLLTANDAACLGYGIAQLNAADLFGAKGKTYLSVSPAGATSAGVDGYRGCLIFEVNSSGTKLKTDTTGALVVSRLIDAPDNRFLGACSYGEGASALGYVVSALHQETAPDLFRMYGSGAIAP